MITVQNDIAADSINVVIHPSDHYYFGTENDTSTWGLKKGENNNVVVSSLSVQNPRFSDLNKKKLCRVNVPQIFKNQSCVAYSEVWESTTEIN